MKLIFCLLISSTAFSQTQKKDTTKPKPLSEYVVFTLPRSAVPTFFDLIDNSSYDHLVVKKYEAELLKQYKQQTDTAKIKK